MVSSDKNRSVLAAFGKVGGDNGMTKGHIFEKFDRRCGLSHLVDAERNCRDIEPARILRQYSVVNRPDHGDIGIVSYGIAFKRFIIVPSDQQNFELWM